MIVADKRDYKNGYRKHFFAYKRLVKDNDDTLSRCLLLAYSVECGLKFKLLDDWGITSVDEIREILQDKSNSKHSVLSTHDLQKIIKELGQEGQFKFPQTRTIHKDPITIETYHQMERYGIREYDKSMSKSNDFEETLKRVADWIEEDI
jgi:hypothetical protein